MLTPALLMRAYLFLGGLEAIAAMAAFVFVLPRAGYVPATTACLGAIVVMQIVNVQLCRSDHESVAVSARRWNGLMAAGIAVEIALMLVIAYTPIGNAVFGTAPIDAPGVARHDPVCGGHAGWRRGEEVGGPCREPPRPSGR